MMQEAEQDDDHMDHEIFHHEHLLLRALERTVIRARHLLNQQGANFSIVMAHHLFGSTRYAGSELFLGLSGLESIPPTIFSDKFDYLALGHLHSAQLSSADPLGVYPGSPIPLHFGEGNNKSVSILEIAWKHHQLEFSQSWKAIPPFRMILSIIGQTSELADKLLTALKSHVAPLPPFIEIRCEGGPLESTDEACLIDIAKQCAGTILKISYQTSQMEQQGINPIPDSASHDFPTSLSLPKVFQAFHRQKYQGAEPSDPLMQTFLNSLEEWSHSTTTPSISEEKIAVDEN